MQTETLISARGLSRYYGQLHAVDQLDFQINRGQVVGFLGPNGAGKTTTMQMLSGVLAPSTGEIKIAGFDILEQPLKAKALIGYLPEQPPLYRELRVREQLNFCARLHKLRGAGLRKNVERAARQCGLTEVMHRLIGHLSKGYQQRVGIAQTILHDPPVVILDEPTVGLDPIQIQEIRELIRLLGKERSVILSTHILSEAQMICNHVQIIHRGRLILDDTAEGLQQRMRTTAVQAVWSRPPAAAALLEIEGVKAVECIDANCYRIQHDAALGFSPVEKLVEKSVAGNWGLHELTPEKRSLEQLFLELTR